MSTRMLDHAFLYASLGWAVLPVRDRGKQPAVAHGVHAATTDHDQLRRWWATGARRGVAIRTGRDPISSFSTSTATRARRPSPLCRTRTGRCRRPPPSGPVAVAGICSFVIPPRPSPRAPARWARASTCAAQTATSSRLRPCTGAEASTAGSLARTPAWLSCRRGFSSSSASGTASGTAPPDRPVRAYSTPSLPRFSSGCSAAARSIAHARRRAPSTRAAPSAHPALHAYPDPAEGWYCFGCAAGGTIIDFGAKVFDIEPRGGGFIRLRRTLAEALLNADGGELDDAQRRELRQIAEEPDGARGFTMVPNSVLRGYPWGPRDRRVSPAGRLLYAAILHYSDAGHRPCTASQTTLGEFIGTSARAVHTHLGELREAGLIEIQPRGRGLPHTIKPALPPDRKRGASEPQKPASGNQDKNKNSTTAPLPGKGER